MGGGRWEVGIRWHYSLNGDRRLPPLILLHGWMGSCEDWDRVIELLKSRFYCIAIDLPGHGKTEAIGDDRGYEFLTTAGGILQLLDDLSIDRCTICGYSFGGRLALYLALEYPNRFDRVVLESTSPGLASIAARQARIASDDLIIQKLATENFPDFAIDWYRQSIFLEIDKHPDFPALLQRRLTNQPDRLAKSLRYAGLGQQPYLSDRLTAYTRSVLLIVGAQDLKFVSIAQTLDRDYHCTSLAIIPNCSHNVHFQAPQLWANLV
jgi:2-succinyl-6-hydroxy-2,4-cyclohexadiene-1-carboxylate synthase